MMIEGIERDIFNRSLRLVGDGVMDAISDKSVIVFGVGGVGSWCAEGLVRSGVKHLTIVDSDLVSITNVNRQLEATTKTVGKVKVEVLRERLLEVNPNAEILALQKIFTDENYLEFDLDSYDYIVDAIDSLKDKISLILRATATHAKLYSAMGAALKMDPTKVRVAEFWDVRGCPLGAMLRKRMRQRETFPAKKFLCVYDEEVLENRGEVAQVYEPAMVEHDWNASKAQINGSTVHITAIFGMTLSGLVIQDIYKSNL